MSSSRDEIVSLCLEKNVFHYLWLLLCELDLLLFERCEACNGGDFDWQCELGFWSFATESFRWLDTRISLSCWLGVANRRWRIGDVWQGLLGIALSFLSSASLDNQSRVRSDDVSDICSTLSTRSKTTAITGSDRSPFDRVPDTRQGSDWDVEFDRGPFLAMWRSRGDGCWRRCFTLGLE